MSKSDHVWTVGKKLWFLCGGLLATLLLMGGVSYWNSSTLVSQVQNIAEAQLPAVRNMTLADMFHDGIRSNVFHAIILSGSDDAEEIKAVRAEGEEFYKEIREAITKIDQLDIREETHKNIAAILPTVDEYTKVAKSLADTALSGKTEKALAGLPEFSELFEKLEKQMEVLGEEISADAVRASEHGRYLARRSNTISFVVLFVGLFVGFVFSVWLIRDLRKTLTAVTSRLGHESRTVASTAERLSDSAQKLSSSNTEQASAIQETAASIDQITAMVKKTSDNSKQLETTAQESHKSAAQGQQSIAQMLAAMGNISDSHAKIMAQVEDGNQKITEIVKVIGEIGNKTKVINDIVFQTKLLSFNASVEAARAGEHGKGFAVVAEEVGNLAQMSGNAAKEISDMLSSSISKVEGIVAESKQAVVVLISDGKHKIEHGTQVATQCGNALAEIVKQTTDVDAMVTEISTAILEQNQGIEEISKAIQLLDQTTHENSASSNESSANAESLLQQSRSLTDIVDSLSALVSGSREMHHKGPTEQRSTEQSADVISLSRHRESKSADARTGVDHASPHVSEHDRGITKMAVGSSKVPSENDPRFEEV